MTDLATSNRVADDGASYLMSVSDIMTGLLFVFVITLMAFVINFQLAQGEAQAEYDSLREEQETLEETQRELEKERDDLRADQRDLQSLVSAYSGREDLRERLLDELQSALLQEEIQVTVDYDHGVLRLDERAIEYESGSASLGDRARDNAVTIAEILAEIVPCYTDIGRQEAIEHGCETETLGTLEASFIEGHTDNVPMIRDGIDQNWELSANRAIRAYREFVDVAPILGDVTNQSGQRVLSVAGYGASRPLPGREYDTPTPDQQNRRIDLRFIMESPRTDDSEVRDALREGIVE
ncbi:MULTISPECIES: OmpA family protein [unclassified Thioalkalivibrio]|uniref:OmpA/MotB family protein n=1 Tax=unclassified Thioalkalivibrio TaxID=2621013 RepID=UPI00037AA5A8|nr:MULTISPECIES: OmpA family protein [unclassified Thioalkalivibrio]